MSGLMTAAAAAKSTVAAGVRLVGLEGSSTADGKKSAAAAGVQLVGLQQLLMRTYLRQLQPFTQAPVPAQLAQMFHVEQRNRLLTI